ncbi:sigma-54-dependent transcriptional regulator [Prosthecobacter fluviatilis]|uniref:DNA-binding transcriptional regulator NtrC n=1 Tax=Prosthecobacter fluviatilis TaxID=445931 RepID=A0ABW0KSA2_9BACT
MPEQGARLLLIDDDDDFASSLLTVLETSGHQVRRASDGTTGVQMAMTEAFDLVICDIRMPGIGGMEVLQRLHAAKPRLPVILMTAFSTTERAIESMKAGAFDYLLKPFDPPEMLRVVERALHVSSAAARPVPLREGEAGKAALIGRSRAMQEVFKQLGSYAATPVPVLILGETGTGKELVARALHLHSRRAEQPFVAVNCAAIPENLIESELFGHEKGAFTHAVARRAGSFEQAQGGTLFLDEIGDIPPAVQAKLLRVLQERRVRRVGGSQELELDMRIITATHRDLSAMIKKGEFREDLLYRLNGAVLRLPPLRERAEDITPLARHFLAKVAGQLGIAEPAIEREALEVLKQHRWPGNVRELENVTRTLLIEARGFSISAEMVRTLLGTPQNEMTATTVDGLVESCLNAARAGAMPGGALNAATEALEQKLYAAALKMAAGNQSQVAEWLGVSRVTVREKLDRYDLLPKRTLKK